MPLVSLCRRLRHEVANGVQQRSTCLFMSRWPAKRAQLQTRCCPLQDLADALDRLAPEGTKHNYRHDDEGPDDMPVSGWRGVLWPAAAVTTARCGAAVLAVQRSEPPPFSPGPH